MTRDIAEQFSGASASSTAIDADNDRPDVEHTGNQHSSPYEYNPLDSRGPCIRLLRLRSAFEGPQSDKRICCSLSCVAFADLPVYEALSYAWGDTTIKRKIWLDGCDFEVPKNLHVALSALRHGDHDRVLWVDAICINQTDVEERNAQ
jgi:hypothetical protein